MLCGDNPLKEEISLDTLELVLKEYQNRQEGGISQEDRVYKEYIDALEQFRKGKPAEKEEQAEPYFPVYYSLVKDNSVHKSYLMLSPASITREIYHRKISDLLGNYRPCSEDEELCPACSLFGTVTETFAKTSRIRFSDLTCKEDTLETCYEGSVTLQPLSSPKISNTEFYLKRPEEARFWTYDYYVDEEGELHLNKKGINGRKFYWHQMDENLKHLEAKEPTKLNVTIRPVKKDICFSGKLYFQDLTQEELKQLCFLLNGGETGAFRKRNTATSWVVQSRLGWEVWPWV